MIKLIFFKLAYAVCGHRARQSLPESPGGDQHWWPAGHHHIQVSSRALKRAAAMGQEKTTSRDLKLKQVRQELINTCGAAPCSVLGLPPSNNPELPWKGTPGRVCWGILTRQLHTMTKGHKETGTASLPSSFRPSCSRWPAGESLLLCSLFVIQL